MVVAAGGDHEEFGGVVGRAVSGLLRWLGERRAREPAQRRGADLPDRGWGHVGGGHPIARVGVAVRPRPQLSGVTRVSSCS